VTSASLGFSSQKAAGYSMNSFLKCFLDPGTALSQELVIRRPENSGKSLRVSVTLVKIPALGNASAITPTTRSAPPI
jgi:hypothetical protein